MLKIASVQVARQRTAPLLLELMTEQRDLVIALERRCLEYYEMTEAHLFQVRGYSPCLGLLPITVLLFRRHRELRLPVKWVEDYLWVFDKVSSLESHGVRILEGTGCSEVTDRAKKICTSQRLRVRVSDLLEVA